jgi:hypothetical protein
LRTIADEPMPYHPFGLTHTGYPAADAAAIGIDLDARPSLAEVMDVRENRMALVRAIIGGLTDADLERVWPSLFVDSRQREGRIGQDVRGLDTHQVISAAA